MVSHDTKELRNKILMGIELAYTRLLADKEKNDEDLVISRNGIIIRIKARELKKIYDHENGNSC